MRLLNTWLAQRLKRAGLLDKWHWSSIALNKNFPSEVHRDGNNAGPSIAKSFGEFTQGGLTYWPNDDGRPPLSTLDDSVSVTLPISGRDVYIYDGRRARKAEPFDRGDRHSLVFYLQGKAHENRGTDAARLR